MAPSSINWECARTAGRAIIHIGVSQPVNHPSLQQQKGKGFGFTQGGADDSAQEREKERKKHTNAHHDEKPSAEPAQVQDGVAGALDEVVRVGEAAAHPVGQRRQHVRGHDQQRVVDAPQRARQDHQEEADG